MEGESSIPHGPAPIRRVYLRPGDPPAYPEAVEAIRHADMIVIGPGNLFTSIMPNLLVEGIAQAIKGSRAMKVYVCNGATQPSEADGYALNSSRRTPIMISSCHAPWRNMCWRRRPSLWKPHFS